MRVANFLYPAGDGESRRRAVSLTLVIAVHLLLLLMLLRLAPPFEERLPQPALKIIPIPPETANEMKTHSAKASAKRAAGGAHPHAQAQPKAPAATSPAQHAPAAPWVLNPALAGFDLAQVPTNPDAGKLAAADSAGSGGGSGASSGPGDSAGAGTGPGGEKLYVAEWYREPSDAELSPYLPRGRHAFGWGEVACRTIEHWHVDDCKEIGQSPPGSGLSRAVREAAWQFLVRPPRVGGKVLVGEWVRIRIDYTEAPAK